MTSAMAALRSVPTLLRREVVEASLDEASVDSFQALQQRATCVWVPGGTIERSARLQPIFLRAAPEARPSKNQVGSTINYSAQSRTKYF